MEMVSMKQYIGDLLQNNLAGRQQGSRCEYRRNIIAHEIMVTVKARYR